MSYILSTHPTTAPARSRFTAGALGVGRFALHFVEMLFAMYAGMLIFMGVPGVMALPPVLHQFGMAVSMTVPMVAWMRVRGHGWRHGFEMAAGMLAPWAAVLGLVAMGAANALPWLSNAADAAMILGMLGIMLFRRDHDAHGASQPHAGVHPETPPARPFPWRRVFVPLAYVSAIVLVPLLVGAINLGSKATAPQEPVAPPAYAGALPAPPADDVTRKTAVVLAGFDGAEIGDTLEAYEILARSGVFNVYSLAPARQVLPLRTGPTPWGNSIDFAPQFSFAEYDAQIGRAPDVIAIPYFQADPGSARDAVVFNWIRGHFGPNTTILGICSGNMVLADSGLLAGRTATTNTGTFDYVESHSPTTTWLHNLRYVDDGNIVTSSNLTSGIDATLHVVDRVAGRATALDVARQIGYTQTGSLDDPRFVPPADDLSRRLIAAGFEGSEQRVGVLMYAGLTEMGVSGIVDPLEGAFSARTFFIAPQRAIVQSRDGFLFVPRYDFSTVPALDRVVAVAGENNAGKQQVLAAWSAIQPRQSVEDIYQYVGAGETAYDASLRDLARTRSGILARITADTLFYAAGPQDFSDASWAPSEVLVAGVLMLLGAAVVFGASRLRLPRRARLEPTPQPA
jgi:transcriptional regulator GlxA family with amidase domain